jgi:hypothetical protein
MISRILVLLLLAGLAAARALAPGNVQPGGAQAARQMPPQQAAPPAPPSGTKTTANIPRLPDGHPDFNGVWRGRGHQDLAYADPTGPPFTEAGKTAFKESYDQYDPTGFCLYPGVTRIVGSPYPTEFVQTPNRLVILYEYMHTFRVAPIDGRPHSADPDPSFFGEAIGKWDGDTLAVDIIGFNDRFWLDPAGHPHSDQLHLVERYWYSDADHIGEEVTIDDPKMYARPWKSTMTFARQPGWELIEYSCDENNKDRDNHHFQKGPSFRVPNPPWALTPGKP